jgi:hypothetical protein
MSETKTPADLTSIRDRFKALWADIHWLAGSRPPEATGKDVNDALKSVRELADDVQKAIDKRTTQGFGKAKDDPELVKLMTGVVGTVEADSHAQHSLWADYAIDGEKYGAPGRTRYSWEQGRSGLGRQVGSIDGHPVMISLLTNTVNGHKLLFYYGMSRVVDHEMIRDWLKANLPETALRGDGYIENTDATNFCNIIFANDRKVAKAAA